MRLTTVIIIITMLQVNASSYAQKISYVRENVTLIQLFKEIKAQTGYNVVWLEKNLKHAGPINVNFKNAPLEEVLDKSLNGLPLTYTVNKRTVVIKEKTPSFLDKIISRFNNVDVPGKVLDESGGPLAGATVKLLGTATAMITNKKGFFSITSKEGRGILTVSFLGYKTAQVDFRPDNPGPFTVVLAQNERGLKEVEINAGYYTVKERERTGSISGLAAREIEGQPVNSPLQALQGRIPGVEIIQRTGIPGGNFSVRIRGQNSINSGNDPLYIIDGVTYPSMKISAATSNAITAGGTNPLSMINPYDIARIEILKDADATAIYGSRGANGVVLITTKRGKEGETKIIAAITQGFSQVGHQLDLLNTPEYLEMRREAFKNDGAVPSAMDYDLNGVWDLSKYTDWQEEIIGGSANTTNTSLNISGGNRKASYLISGNYYNEGLVFPGDFGFKRGGVHSSLNLNAMKSRLTTSFTASYSHSKSRLPNSDPTANIVLPPNAPDPYDQYGQLNWAGNTVYLNPMASLLRTIYSRTDNLIGNVNISYRIVKGLLLKASIGYNKIDRQEQRKLPLASTAPAFELTAANRESNFSNNHNNSWLAEPQLTYAARVGPGNLDALFGLSFQENRTDYRNVKATGFSSDESMENIASAALLVTGENTFSQYRYTATFARLNYSLFNRYYLNLTARRDGSSRFGQGKQFANFGAIGAAWIFSDEKFIKDKLPFLNLGKLRGSYGITGNDQINDYGYLQLWSVGSTYEGLSAITPTRISNPDYAWETNRKTEVSLQLEFLKNNLDLEISYYRNLSSNQLIGIPLPPSTGSNSIQANLPATVQNTGWEFAGDVHILRGKNWNWSAGLNLTVPKNKLIAYPGLSSSTNATKYIIGRPLSIHRYYNTSVDSQTGLYIFEDSDGSGTRNDNDKYLNTSIGQSYYGGFRNTVRFKRLSLNFLISFTRQTGNNYLSDIVFSPGYFSAFTPQSNVPAEVFRRWTRPGGPAVLQKFTRTNNLTFLTARIDGGLSIVDASFLRLKNIVMNYHLPFRRLSKAKIKDLELSVQGQNVFTVTKYTGLDPESQSLLNLPPLRTFSMGVKLTF